jgi:hypothetical protein
MTCLSRWLAGCAANCLTDQQTDAICQPECNVQACNFDNGVCLPSESGKLAESPPLFWRGAVGASGMVLPQTLRLTSPLALRCFLRSTPRLGDVDLHSWIARGACDIGPRNHTLHERAFPRAQEPALADLHAFTRPSSHPLIHLSTHPWTHPPTHPPTHPSLLPQRSPWCKPHVPIAPLVFDPLCVALAAHQILPFERL